MALRAVRSGEEICYDYAMTDSNPYMHFACKCGTPLCRGAVRADDWRRPDLRKRYGRAFSHYLLKRMQAERLTHRVAKPANERGAELHQNGGALLHKAVKTVALKDQHLHLADGGNGR